jgi:hypothetical protein
MGTIIIPPMKHDDDDDVVEDIDIQQLLEVQFESDDWEVVGLVVSTSQASYIPLVLQALEMETHPDAMVATFGSSQEILGLDTNHNIVFVVDDQAYLFARLLAHSVVGLSSLHTTGLVESEFPNGSQNHPRGLASGSLLS